jgi:hypothetical protein
VTFRGGISYHPSLTQLNLLACCATTATLLEGTVVIGPYAQLQLYRPHVYELRTPKTVPDVAILVFRLGRIFPLFLCESSTGCTMVSF